MKDYKIMMVLEPIKIEKTFEVPQGYHIRHFKQDDVNAWTNILTQAFEFENKVSARQRFYEEFGDDLGALETRCFFLENKNHEPIGTIMAWYGNIRGKLEGRIHWLSIIPKYQGQGLSKPLLSCALKILKLHHETAYLITQTSSIAAINLYLHFGFKPYMDEKTHLAAWPLIKHKITNKR